MASTDADLGYTYQVAYDSNFTAVVYQGSTSLLYVDLTDLQYGSAHYWRVMAKGNGGNSIYSAGRSFTVITFNFGYPAVSLGNLGVARDNHANANVTTVLSSASLLDYRVNDIDVTYSGATALGDRVVFTLVPSGGNKLSTVVTNSAGNLYFSVSPSNSKVTQYARTQTTITLTMVEYGLCTLTFTYQEAFSGTITCSKTIEIT